MPETIPADAAIQVVIARESADLSTFGEPLVVVYPDYDNWNDYGRNFFATLRIRASDDTALELHMRMMFEGRAHSSTVFDEMLGEYGDAFPIEQVSLPFASLLTDVDDYRKVIDALGFDAGVSALRKLHDAVVARTEGNDLGLLALIDSEEFHFGALRNGGAYEALRRGGRFFRRELPAPVVDAAVDFIFTAQLHSAHNRYTMPFLFAQDAIFRDRVSVLIGRNGVGKTQLLKSIVDALHSNHPPDRGQSRFFPAFRPSRVLVFSSVPSDPFPRAIGAWHGIDYEYFAVNASTQGEVDPLLSALVACRKSDGRGGFGQQNRMSRMDVIEATLEPMGLWRRLHLPLRPRREGDELPGVISIDGQSYFPIGRRLNEANSIRLVQQIDWRRTPVVLDDHLAPRHLSSGEYAMLRFAAQASAAIEQGSLLLLDEPETHLHPNFVSDLMEVLDNLLQSTGSVAIIATHSPYVVRETPRNRVNVLTLEDDQIRIDAPRLQTFGASVDSISQFVFGDTNVSHRYQKTLAEWADRVGRPLGIEAVIEEYGAELNSESLSFIARRLAEPPDGPSDAFPDEPEIFG